MASSALQNAEALLEHVLIAMILDGKKEKDAR